MEHFCFLEKEEEEEANSSSSQGGKGYLDSIDRGGGSWTHKYFDTPVGYSGHSKWFDDVIIFRMFRFYTCRLYDQLFFFLFFLQSASIYAL